MINQSREHLLSRNSRNGSELEKGNQNRSQEELDFRWAEEEEEEKDAIAVGWTSVMLLSLSTSSIVVRSLSGSRCQAQ